MSEPFDPYRKWLGIPPRQQPPHHYRLLGINLFEDDADVIEAAADRQMAFIRTFQSGPNSAASQQLLNELAAARVCLLNAEKKAAYDNELRQRLMQQRGTVAPEPLSLGALIEGATRYAGLVLRRCWIRWVRLPEAYRQLGLDAYAAGRHRQCFPDVYRQLDQHGARLVALQAAHRAAGEDQAAKGVWAAVKRFFKQLGSELRQFFVTRRQSRLVCRLGEGIYEAQPQAVGLEALTIPIRDDRARLAQIEAQLADLSRAPGDGSLSPRGFAWLIGGIAAAGLALILFLRMVL